MSEVKVNKITPTTNCGTVTLGDSGDTVAIPCGVTLSNSGSITNSGTITNTGTISGGTITGTIDGQVNWQTTVKTTGFTATAGEGYFCNTTSAAFTVTLPASPSAGDIVGIKDYANTADTNNITIGRNGSNIQGDANDYVIDTEGLSIVLLYVDSTKGWLSVGQAKASDISEQEIFITATGGTITTCGNCKIHTFTSPGTFCVSQINNLTPANNQLSYMVVAGGGGGGGRTGGGGGAGGFREDKAPVTPYTASPLEGAGTINATVTSFPITVGGGGTGGPGATNQPGTDGSNSVFSTITSTGGGGGAGGCCPTPSEATGRSGGSGGGGGYIPGPGPSARQPGGSGNTPPVSPSQGNNGGAARATLYAGGGGGGATAVGAGGNPSGGGAGATTSISGSPTAYGGGGGGGSYQGSGTPIAGGAGGTGGGGAGSGLGTPACGGVDGTANTGGGGGAGGGAGNKGLAGDGGSGIVIIRYKFQ